MLPMKLSESEALLLLWYVDPWAQISPDSPLPWLWLGAQDAPVAWEGRARGPVLISAPRMRERWSSRGRRRGDVPRFKPRPATVPVMFDSQAYTQISTHGRWTVTAKEYADFIVRASAELGTVQFVGTQDWMCEAHVLRKTGLDVAEHQRRTVQSFIELREMAPEVPWMATLQGHTGDDYLRCRDEFERAGVDLAKQRLVGLGSVCRRSGTRELVDLIERLTMEMPGVDFHGYGVKSDGVLESCTRLRSIDSAAGSMRGRKGWEWEIRLALGLAVDADFAEVKRAVLTRANVDPDHAAFIAWKVGAGEEASVSNSHAWAEWWRLRQQINLAMAVRDADLARAPAIGPCPRAEQAQLGLSLPLVTGRADVFYGAPKAARCVQIAVMPGDTLAEIITLASEGQAGDPGHIFEIQTDDGVYDLRALSYRTWQDLEAAG